MQNEIYIWGSGGGAFEIKHLLEDLARAGKPYVLKGVVGRGPCEEVGTQLGLPYIDVDQRGWESLIAPQSAAVVTAGMPELREVMAKEIATLGLARPVLIHPSAVVSSTARLAEGCIVGPNATISAYVDLAESVYVSFNASIGHHSSVGPHGVISPGARLGGEVVCGSHLFVGLSGVVVPRVHVGHHVSISAGALVSASLPDGSKVIQQKSRVLGSL